MLSGKINKFRSGVTTRVLIKTGPKIEGFLEDSLRHTIEGHAKYYFSLRKRTTMNSGSGLKEFFSKLLHQCVGNLHNWL